jgi:hypothetical protein
MDQSVGFSTANTTAKMVLLLRVPMEKSVGISTESQFLGKKFSRTQKQKNKN